MGNGNAGIRWALFVGVLIIAAIMLSTCLDMPVPAP
jgi:hypothetical protein